MDPDTGSHRLTTEQGTWRARCPETGTPGSGGGLGKRASGNTGTAPEAYLTRKSLKVVPCPCVRREALMFRSEVRDLRRSTVVAAK